MVPNRWPILLKIKLYYLCISFSFLSNDIVACLISLDFLKYMISRIWKKFTISIVKYSHVGSTDSLMCSDICNVGWNIIYPYSWWIFNLINILCFQDKSRQTEKGEKKMFTIMFHEAWADVPLLWCTLCIMIFLHIPKWCFPHGTLIFNLLCLFQQFPIETISSVSH